MMVGKRKAEPLEEFTQTKECKSESEIPSLPTEIWMSIFSYAQSRTLASCALTCHTWNAMVSSEHIWKSLFFHQYMENYFDLENLPENDRSSWKEIYRDYAFFIKKVNQVKECRALQRIRKDAICPFVEHSNSKFYLSENPKVILEKEETKSPSVIFQGEAVLTHLAVENHFLFALTSEGDVVTCDIETKSFQKLDKKQTQPISYKQSNTFVAHEGWVVKISSVALEVIPYAHPESSQVYTDHFFDPFLLISQIVNDRLYLVDQYSLSIWDLSNGQRIDYIPLSNMLRYQFMCIKDNNIYLADQLTIYLVNLENKSITQFMSIRSKIQFFPHAMHFLGDHFLMVYYEDTVERGRDVFSMIDVREKKFIIPSAIKNVPLKK